jgi:hypothetical protein
MLLAGDLLNPEHQMPSLPTSEPQLVLSTRFERAPAAPSGRRYALEGAARPGDVLVLAAGGGVVVYDVNQSGYIDGADAPVHADGVRFGRLVDVRA